MYEEQCRRLDQENDDLDKWIVKRGRMNKWLGDVARALKQGDPVPEHPEDSEFVYPGYIEEHEASEETPGAAEEAPAPSTAEAPAETDKEETMEAPCPQEKEDTHNEHRVPLDQAIAALCGKEEAGSPQSPLRQMLLCLTNPQWPQRSPPLVKV